MLAFEYGITPVDVGKLTRREISDLLDGLASRKNGYPEKQAAVTIETNPSIDKKIEDLYKKRFVKNGS